MLVFGVMFIWGIVPVQSDVRSTPLFASEFAITQPKIMIGPPNSGSHEPLAGDLELSIPQNIRLGDPTIIRLVFSPIKYQESISINNQIFQAYLDLPGIQYTPTGDISQSISFDHPDIFLWNLRPKTEGDFKGKVWLYLDLLDGDPDQDARRVISAQQIEIKVSSFLGLGGSEARIIGFIGFITGAVLGMDLIFQRLIKVFIPEQ